MSLGMTSNESVTSTPEQICNSKGEYASDSDFVNFSMVLDEFPPIARSFVKHLSESPTTQCCNLPTNLIDHWVKCAAEKFPKNAMGLPDAEIQFQKSVKDNKENVLIPEWIEQYQDVNVQDNMTLLKFRRLGPYTYTTIFSWSSLTQQSTPSVHPFHSQRIA